MSNEGQSLSNSMVEEQLQQSQSEINPNDPQFQQFLKELNETLEKIHNYSPSPGSDINPLLAHGVLTKQFDIKSIANIFQTDLKYLFNKRIQIEAESLIKNYGRLVLPLLDKFSPMVDTLLKQIARMSVHEMSLAGSPELKNIIIKLIHPLKTFITAFDNELNASVTNQMNNQMNNNPNGFDMSQMSGLMGNVNGSHGVSIKMPKFKKRGGSSKNPRKFSKTLKKLRFKK